MDYTTAKRTFQSLVNKEENPATKQLLNETFYSWVKEHHPLEYTLHQIKQSSGVPEGASIVDCKSIVPIEHKTLASYTGFPLNQLKAFNWITISHPDWKRTYIEGNLEFDTDTLDKWEYPEAVEEQRKKIAAFSY